VTSYAEANRLRKLVRRLAGTAPGAWVFARTAHRADRLVYRLSGERTTLAAIVSGLPVVMLVTTGAKSGRETRSPLLGVVEDDAVIVVGSNFGRPHHPAWIHNLRADPRARVEVEGRVRDVQAVEAEGAERERYLALATEIYPGFPAYVKRAAPRRIAIIRLIPYTSI
jgi:deazaflavin-dependent oxidoreductase (nitroreductase family)